MVTREDVAKAAHVSTATVSNVINNKPGVSDDLRQHVMQAIETLGYRPNLIARSLKTKETRQIALVTNGISNPYFAEVARGMEEEAYLEGYMVSILNARSERDYVDALINRQFDGIILANDKMQASDINRLIRFDIPTVFIGNEGYSGFDPGVIFVNIDLYGGARKLFELLAQSGHKRIGFITARRLKNQAEPDYRLKAYREVFSLRDQGMDSSLIYMEDDTPEYAYTSSCSMLSLPSRPTAVFTGNDYLAPSVYAAIHEHGLRIPEDISVVGFDNLSLSRYLVPSLTTVEVPDYELGKKVIAMLLSKMKGAEVGSITMETTVVERKSVRAI